MVSGAGDLGTVGLKVEVDWDDLQRESESRIKNIAGGIGRGFVKGTGAIAAGVGKATLAVGAAGAAIAGFGLKTAAEMELSAVAFETLLGNAELAEDTYRDLVDFAAKTPFELPGLTRAEQSLIAAGVETERLIPLMTGMGDVMSGLGGGTAEVERGMLALQKAQAKGRLDMETMNILAEAGIPIFDAVAEKLGVTTEEMRNMVSAGEVTADVLFDVFEDFPPVFEKFRGGAERASQTLAGVLSTLKDTVSIGLADSLTPVLGTLIPVVKSLSESLGPILSSIGALLVPVLTVFANVLSDDLVPALAVLVEEIGPIFAEWFEVLGGLISSVLPIVTSLITQLVQGLGPILIEIAKVFESDIVPVIGVLVDAVLPPLLDLFRTLWTSVLEPLLPTIILLAELFAKLVPPIANVIGLILDALGPVFGELIAVLAEALIPVLEALLPIIDPLLIDVLDLVMVFIEPLIPIIQFLAEVISTILIVAIGVLTDYIGWLIEVIEPLIEWVAGLAEALGTWLNDSLEGIQTWFKELPDKIRSFVENAVQWLWDTGRDIIRGLWEGIKSMGEWIKDKLIGFVKAIIPDPIEGILGISSPSKLMMGIGQEVGRGLALGILDTEKDVLAASHRLAEATGMIGPIFQAGSGALPISGERFKKGDPGEGPFGSFEDWRTQEPRIFVHIGNEEIAEYFVTRDEVTNVRRAVRVGAV